MPPARQTAGMDRFFRFLNRMDRTHVRTVLITGIMFALVVLLLLLGHSGGFVDFVALEAALQELRSSEVSFLIVASVFCIGAFLGAPQFGLFAAVIAVFGPWQGAAYCWAATMTSSAITFWAGRLAGETTFRRYAGAVANNLAEFVGRNALTASAVVRLLPTAPFIVVNMAFGVSRARFLHFWIGTGAGIVPKIILVAFAGQTVFATLAGSPLIAGLSMAGLAALWIGLALMVRRIVRSGR